MVTHINQNWIVPMLLSVGRQLFMPLCGRQVRWGVGKIVRGWIQTICNQLFAYPDVKPTESSLP